MLRVVVLMRGKMEPTRKTGHRAAHRAGYTRQLRIQRLTGRLNVATAAGYEYIYGVWPTEL